MTGTIRFPDMLRATVVDAQNGTRVAGIVVRLAIRAPRKNDFVVSAVTDAAGVASFSRSRVERDIRDDQMMFPMDYVSISLDGCPELSFRIPSGQEVQRQLEAIARYKLPVDQCLQEGLKQAVNWQFQPGLDNLKVESRSPELWEITIQVRRGSS